MSPYDDKPKTERIMEELKLRQHDRRIVDVEEEVVKVVIFSIAAKQYAFYGASVKEILPAGNISWIPSLPEFIPGLITIRGDIESVVNISFFLGEKSPDLSCCYIALVVTDSFRTGIMVDSVDDVVDVQVSSIKPPLATLSGVARELVCGEIVWNRVTVALLDIAKLEARITL